MNKLYYLLVLPFLLFTACDEGGVENVYLQQQDTDIIVEKVAPAQGYVGEQIVLTGKGFGNSKEFLKVYIGDFQCELVSCTDERAVVSVPEEAVTGKILLKVVKKMLDTGKNFTVLNDPVLSLTASSGYLNGNLVFTGTNMPAKANNFSVLFEENKAEIVADSYQVDENGNGVLVVKTPKKMEIGRKNVAVNMFGRKIYEKGYTILATPSVEIYGKRWVKAGETTTFYGEGFGNFANAVDKVKVDFNGKEVAPTAITENTITVTVPDGFTTGNVWVKIEGIPDIEAGEAGLWNAASGADVTSLVLVNSVQPFNPIGSKIPEGWMFNDTFIGDALDWGKDKENGLLVFQKGWGLPEKINAKMYQQVILPAGQYKFDLTVAECGKKSSVLSVSFVVAEGANAIPDWSETITGVLGVTSIVDQTLEYGKGTASYSIKIELTEETVITAGFIAQITGGSEGWVKVSSIKVTLE